LFLGSLLGRKREARVNYPGGCSIGKRPIDYHLDAFRKMGVKVTEEDEQVSCKARRIKGQKIALEFPSVGATENIILAACLADGVTWITGAAREPEIVELCHFLRLAGAVIEGEGTDHIFIRGVKKLRNTEFTVCHDRIVLSTLGLLVAGTGGNVLLKTGEKKVPGDIQILSRTGCICKAMEGRVLIRQNRKPKAIYYIKTRPYPGFPTDVQSPLMAVMTKAEGDTIIDESIFENRMQTADELNKLGADITVVGNRAFIRGVKSLEGTSVRATDLRGGMALVIAGLMAEGKTKIENEEVILRGYENLPESLSGIGAKIYYE
ncbi:MAG: UDP-N-acetylglucosamine 1-carboxyvinyltransferase, partial [Lachnospiraceae bacterium]|nr:UDP-N-acetylglucosamine 1-carboxyvinyltransferase [Lachnospiraceae bacterium]